MNRVRAALVERWPHLASKAEWVRRGYKVRRGEQYAEYVQIWNGMHYNKIKLYRITSCDKIKGKKAEERRRNFMGSAYGGAI